MNESLFEKPTTAVLIPCFNEELTIAEVVRHFRTELPDAAIYVFDNNSSDRTAEVARQAGAIVKAVKQQGKGYVVRFMFQNIDADIYIMVDGDGTYPAPAVHRLIDPVINDEADMVVGSRLHDHSQSLFRLRNRLGNKLVLSILNTIFRVRLTDILSGYRAFNRRLVKDLPLFGGGFEIETELTIKTLERGYRITEVPVDLSERPSGSESKIRFIRDGTLILNTILVLFRDYKPLTFFGLMGVIIIAVGMIPGLLVILEFIQTGLIRHLPSAILAVGLVLTGMLLLMVGLILHTISRRFQELDHHLQVLISQRTYEPGTAEHSRVPKQQATDFPADRGKELELSQSTTTVL